MYHGKPSFEARHPIAGENPTRVPLDSFTSRSNVITFPAPRIKIGDVIEFPLDEEAVLAFTTKNGCRLIAVKQNDEEAYLSIARLFAIIKDGDGRIVNRRFSELYSDYKSDAEIIKSLLGHTIRCISGESFFLYIMDPVRKELDKSQIRTLQVPDFEIIESPIFKNVWYKRDNNTYKVLPDCDYSELSIDFKILLDHSCADLVSITDYLRFHHGVSTDSAVCLFFEDGFSLDDDGLISAIVSIKNTNGDYTMFRDMRIRISPILFLEHRLEGDLWWYSGIYGIRTLSSLISLFQGNKVMMEIAPHPFEPLFRFLPVRVSPSIVVDDLGALAFPIDSGALSQNTVLPKKLTERSYSLVGVNYRAPYSNTKDQSCILIAQKDNPYDKNAIEVRRWFPRKIQDFVYDSQAIKHSLEDKAHQEFDDGIYEWGFISRDENSELHHFMIENDCWLLFGKTDSRGMISILGGVEQFVDGYLKGYAMPLCISSLISNV